MLSVVEITGPTRMQVDVTTDFCCFVTVITLVTWSIIAVFTYRDAKSRGMEGGTWALLALLFGVITLIIYLFFRDDKYSSSYEPIYEDPLRYDYPEDQPEVSPQPPGPHLMAPVRYSPPKVHYCSVCGRRLSDKTFVCPRCGN